MGYSLSDPDIKKILINVSNSLGKNILDNVFYVAFVMNLHFGVMIFFK